MRRSMILRRLCRRLKTAGRRAIGCGIFSRRSRGLGYSSTVQYYAVKDRKEAEAYMKHPVLGSRLLKISGELLKLNSCNAADRMI